MKTALCITKSLLAVLPLLALVMAASAYAAEADVETLVKFRGGIGVIPVSSGVVENPLTDLTADVVNRNFVRGVQPPGQIWVIARLRARVKFGGSIRVDGRGLLLGGGDNVGGNGNASVFATLICEAVAPFVELSTDPNGVPLEPNGDFRIDDVLTPAPPAVCDSPVLLIRNASNRAWFAAGIPER